MDYEESNGLNGLFSQASKGITKDGRVHRVEALEDLAESVRKFVIIL